MNFHMSFVKRERSKVKMKKFWGTKNPRNFLKGLKQKVDIFIRTRKKKFNPFV